MQIRINILCVTDYFIPGYLGGGPITTIVNMRRQLAGKVVFSIYTRNHDLGVANPFPGIDTDMWVETPDGPVYYAGAAAFGARGILRALSETKYDVVYLNSFFSPRASIFPLLALRSRNNAPRVLLAPRGEFSPGALGFKRTKKTLFLAFAKITGLYKGVFWHASTAMEADDILRVFPHAAGRVFVAADPVFADSSDTGCSSQKKESGRLKIAFISRISPKKNLDGLIRVLAKISLLVSLDIFGPIEDPAYWKICSDLIATLPENITVSAHGSISPESVTSTFAQYDLFAFPTHGENFGHVIFEALRAGTPVLVSDQTPWQHDETGALTIIPLRDTLGWKNAIENAVRLNGEEQGLLQRAARSYAIRYAQTAGAQKESFELFSKVLSF